MLIRLVVSLALSAAPADHVRCDAPVDDGRILFPDGCAPDVAAPATDAAGCAAGCPSLLAGLAAFALRRRRGAC